MDQPCSDDELNVTLQELKRQVSRRCYLNPALIFFDGSLTVSNVLIEIVASFQMTPSQKVQIESMASELDSLLSFENLKKEPRELVPLHYSSAICTMKTVAIKETNEATHLAVVQDI